MRALLRIQWTAVAIATLVLGGFASSSMYASEPTGQRHVIEIRKFKFHPSSLDVSPGDTIVWINKDIVPHTATADDKAWDSPKLGKNEEWEMVVQSATSETYFCRFHPNMKARIKFVSS